MFHLTSCLFYSQSLNKLCWSVARFCSEGAPKVARTQMRNCRELVSGKGIVKMFSYIGKNILNSLRVGMDVCNVRKLRLATQSPMRHDEHLSGELRHARA